MKEKRLIAIGDSFFYLSDHVEEGAFRFSEGVLKRLGRLLEGYRVVNLGINGATTETWLTAPIEKGDAYLIFLGTNDWWSTSLPIGSQRDYLSRTEGTILGNLGKIVGRIKSLSPGAMIFLCNPVERGDFVCVDDPFNFAKGSYESKNGRTLAEIANAIASSCREENLFTINTHDKSGFSCFNAVKFKRCFQGGKLVDLPYPNYIRGIYDPEEGIYPYPKEAIDMTYDGLHPSDLGAEKLAETMYEGMKYILEPKDF